MAYHNYLAQDITLPPFADQHLAEVTGKPTSTAAQPFAGGPTWLHSANLRQQHHQFVTGAGDCYIPATGGGGHEEVEGTWQSARYKAEILAHPLYEQLLSAHVACLRIATPVDQLPRIDGQLAQSQHVVGKYSVMSGQIMAGEEKELDQFMDNSILYWRKFVAEYFSPRAKKRWCFSLYNSAGNHAFGAFPTFNI